MVVKIKFRKVYDKKKKEPKRVVIEEVSGVIDERKLPYDYLMGRPKFYKSYRSLVVYSEEGKIFGDWVNFDGEHPDCKVEIGWSEFKRLVEVMRQAGDRLHEINKRHAMEKELWESEEVEEIEI